VNDTPPQNATEEEQEPPVYDVNLVDFFPKQINVGDSQLNLYVENTGNQDLNSLMAIITGEGISTYDVTPIETLKPDQKSYIIARINAKESGMIDLQIKILDDVFERKIAVRNPEEEQGAIEQQREEERRKERLDAAAKQLSNLTDEYDSLEELYYAKKNQGFDLASIDLKDAKGYLRDAQAGYTKGDVDATEASLVILRNELNDLSALLENVQKPKRSFGQWIKDNSTFVVTFGYILGIIISLFTIIELVKKNKASLAEKMGKERAEKAEKAYRPEPQKEHHPKAEIIPTFKPVKEISKPAQERTIKPRPKPKQIPKAQAKPMPVHKRKPLPKPKKSHKRPRLPSKSRPAKPSQGSSSQLSADSASRKYKINKAKPTTHYVIQPADDEF
jgi:hypothetical protein